MASTSYVQARLNAPVDLRNALAGGQGIRGAVVRAPRPDTGPPSRTRPDHGFWEGRETGVRPAHHTQFGDCDAKGGTGDITEGYRCGRLKAI